MSFTGKSVNQLSVQSAVRLPKIVTFPMLLVRRGDSANREAALMRPVLLLDVLAYDR
ncbi:Uncharacterised protein [Pseudomonas luteola]|uniref:Uncharacterized protein n=1 Tax=Pseudomonas luteola TaxID=47886 RepID=A0A2X2D991_PSELU|nr:Uncharacterised protein [Pseudomonas luteola]